jgi:molybdate transport system permease protein
MALPLLLVLAVPVIMLLAKTTPAAFAAELANPQTRSAMMISLWTSGVALVVTIVLGAPLAYWLARTRTRLGALVETLVDLPTVLPPSVAGIALLLTLGRNGVIGGWLEAAGIRVAFTPLAVVLAQVFVAAPYFVRGARAGFASVGQEVREAAIVDGANGTALFWKVMVPLAWRSLAAGAAMSWSRAVGEFGATMLFAGNLPGLTQTMPLAVYLGFEQGLDRALALSVVLIAMAVAVLVAVRLLGRR